MREISTTVEIDAPVSAVWDALVDFAAYPTWNDRTRVTGVAEAGERLTVAAEPAAGRMPTFRPTVLVADGRELRWRGRLYVPVLFDGEHAFRLDALADGRTRLTQSERFSGVVRPLLALYGGRTRANFVAANDALRAYVEARVDARGEGADDDADATAAAETSPAATV